MNKQVEEPIRRLLQVTATIMVDRICPATMHSELEAARAGVLGLYVEAADKKKVEAEDLIDKSHLANEPWKPNHPLLVDVPDKDYTAKQLKSDVAGEKAAPILAHWADCAACEGKGPRRPSRPPRSTPRPSRMPTPRMPLAPTRRGKISRLRGLPGPRLLQATRDDAKSPWRLVVAETGGEA